MCEYVVLTVVTFPHHIRSLARSSLWSDLTLVFLVPQLKRGNKVIKNTTPKLPSLKKLIWSMYGEICLVL